LGTGKTIEISHSLGTALSCRPDLILIGLHFP
jgi:hypothetical protein